MSRKAEIAARLSETRSNLRSEVTLIVVTKTFPISDIEILYELGERNFGENRDAEGAEKSAALPDDVIWHFQGGIQSNKLKSIVGWSDYIHSLDDIDHARKISEIAVGLKKRQRCFIQVNLDNDEVSSTARSGVKPAEVLDFANSIMEFPGIEVVGVMGVGALNQDPRVGFATLQSCSELLKNLIPGAFLISAGMSGDYEVAMEYGATHVRLGSSILGVR